MAVELTDRKISQKEADSLMSSMELDFIALFNLMENDFLQMTEDFEGTPEQLIDAIIGNLSETESGGLVKKTLRTSTVAKAAYKLQGRKEIQGLKISIENRKGSVRSGVDDSGHEWQIKMKHPYGYIRLTEGTDGDHVDCYLGENEQSTRVFIIHQNNPDTGAYDEDKVMIGFDSPDQAKAAYLEQYDLPGFFGKMTEVTMEDFKSMLDKNRGKKLTKSGGVSMPTPRSGESEQDFVSRCIPEVLKEGATQDQAAGKCYGIYRNAKKSEMFNKASQVLKNLVERIK